MRTLNVLPTWYWYQARSHTRSAQTPLLYRCRSFSGHCFLKLVTASCTASRKKSERGADFRDTKMISRNVVGSSCGLSLRPISHHLQGDGRMNRQYFTDQSRT